MKLAFYTALVFVVLAGNAQADSCLRDGDKITGEIRNVETRHVSDHKLLSYRFLTTFKPVCVDDKDLGHAEGKWVQIVLKNQADFSRLILGDTATITAHYEPPMTAYHLGDLMAFDAQIVSVTPP